MSVSADGHFGIPWTLTSPRHSTVRHVAPTVDDAVVFFATTNGPITHSGDQDPFQNFNEGRLGIVSPVELGPQ